MLLADAAHRRTCCGKPPRLFQLPLAGPRRLFCQQLPIRICWAGLIQYDVIVQCRSYFSDNKAPVYTRDENNASNDPPRPR